MTELAATTITKTLPSFLDKTNMLIFIGKGTFVYVEFDSQATEPNKALTIADNKATFTLPPNYYPFMFSAVAISDDGFIDTFFPVEKISYNVNTGQVTLEPPNGWVIDNTKHWVVNGVCVGVDISKGIDEIISQTGSVDREGDFYIINYSDTAGTDTIIIRYTDGSSEVMTVDKGNLWTVRPFEPYTGGGTL